MELMEQLVDVLGKLPDGTPDDVKGSIKGLFQKVNQEAGKAKTDLDQYKKGDSEYKKLQKKLQEAKLDPDQFDSIAEQLGIHKTLQDEHAILQAQYKETLKRAKEYEGQLKQSKMESILGKKFDEVAKAYKTPDGKTIKLAEEFVDTKELYKDIDLESDLIVQDRIQKVAKGAFEKQTAFFQKLGVNFQGTPVHQVPNGDGTFGSGKALDEGQVKTLISTSKGDPDAAARALTLYEQASKQ